MWVADATRHLIIEEILCHLIMPEKKTKENSTFLTIGITGKHKGFMDEFLSGKNRCLGIPSQVSVGIFKKLMMDP